MQMLKRGESVSSIHRKYGISESQLHVLWAKYQLYGVSGLRKGKNIKADATLRKQIVLDIEKNHLTLSAASLKYGASVQRLSAWLRMYREGGVHALEFYKKRGRPRSMGRPRKNSKPLTELERLQKENQELKTEIALLKKVRALVEERKARLRETGQGPSRN